MNEEVQMFMDDAKERMENAVKHLDQVLGKLRAGKASPQLLADVKVDYYGATTPLSQVSNINTPDGQTIRVQPWEKNMIEPIEKAIMNANLGFNPSNNGEAVIINVPPLTEERRKELVKQVKKESEDAKVSIRNARRDANDEFKKLKNEGLSEDEEKRAEEKVQDLTNQHIEKVEELIDAKEAEIMKV
ncbi:Vegetative protein 12B [Salinivirga cyanobacteriivorans]|uniref:Ribosome-recycling factor n=1 Tax=Salinivirga cyanobacteriivorans TaxID=1307839 RepID=A0A0S2I0Y4_9BACT|nr:ribosome recycling factor [Salinivirga cyanobacteriivorans]ALO15968.1 Vegetative protein 12B [Salinivirga cyanobacteriivorans]